MKLLPGTYVLITTLMYKGPHELTLAGEATIHGAVSVMAPVRIRRVDIVGALMCGDGGTSIPTATLEHVTIQHAYPHTVGMSRCKLAMFDSRIASLDGNVPALQLTGGGGGGGQLATIENSVIEMLPAPAMNTAAAIQIDSFASLRMTNSIVRGGPSLWGAIYFGTNVGASSITFSTFYNLWMKCPNAPAYVESRNNIFLNETSDAPADTLKGTACVHSYVLVKPQATIPDGTNNVLNVDPAFVNAASGDFHLSAGSPAIDAADPAATEPVDLEGEARPQGAARDIGAFEYH